MGHCLSKKDEIKLQERKKSKSFDSDLAVNKLGIEDFHVKNLIGTGANSDVFLVMSRRNLKHYAMKIIKKNTLKSNTDIKHALMERKILEKLSHPFLIKFYFAFQTKYKLHLVLEYTQGGDLYNYLLKKDGMPEKDCRFYAAEILCALEYLHKHEIIFRGLKPEDVLIDAEGHIKLTDFGLAKYQYSTSRTF